MKLAFIVSSILLTISILIEPDYTTFFILAILFGSIIAGFLNKDLIYRFKYAFLAILSSVISIFFVIYGLYLTAGIGTSVSSVGALRIYNFATVSFFSGNITPLRSLILVGHFWSTVVYAPPSILLYSHKIRYVNSLMYPSQLLLPNGFTTYLWLFTIIMIPILSLLSLIFKATRKISFPVTLLFVLFYTMSMVYYIKPLFYIELYLSNLPVVGNAIGTTLSLPGHIINVIAAMYYILFSITIINILNKRIHINLSKANNKLNIHIEIFEDIIKRTNSKFKIRNNKFKVFIVFFLLFIVLFSGWQAFDGSFYPARAPEVSNGNGVANIGAFTPVSVNSSVIHAYNLISSQSERFNIIWIGGPEYSERPYGGAHSGAKIPNLAFLTSNDMKSAFYYDLIMGNVKYIVLSNQDIQKNIPGIFVQYTFNSAGFKNFNNAQSFMSNITGLKIICKKNQVDIFEVSGFTQLYKTNTLLNYNGNSPYLSSLPYLFNSLRDNVSITDSKQFGIPVSINNNNKGISIYTPINIANFTPNTNSRFYNMSGHEKIAGMEHNYATSLPNNFTLTLWSNNQTYYNYSDGVTNISNYKSSDESISYNGSFDSGAGGYFVNKHCVNLTVTFYAKSSKNGTDSFVFMGEPVSNSSTDNIYNTINFNVSKCYKKYSFSEVFPNSEKYIDFRLFDLINGTFYLKNLCSKYESLPSIVNNPSLPFGNYMKLSNTMIHGKNSTALIYLKNDTMNNFEWIRFNFSNGLYLKTKSKIAALILINNITSLDHENKSYIVSVYPSSREYELNFNAKLYTSIPGIYGNSIFIISGNATSLNDMRIITEGKTIMDLYYIGIILYLTMLTCFMVNIYRKNKI
jgi:hypothetical protein